MASITMQAEFSLFPDDTVLGPTFTLNGFGFTDKAGPASFVNISGSEKGLQFGKLGVEVKLPVKTPVVSVRAAAFAGDFSILGRNSVGSVVATATIPGDNAPHVVTLLHPGLTDLEFVGGGNEGLIDEISYQFDCASAEVEETEVSGNVRDIDFSAERTQVIIVTGPGGADQLIAWVADDRMQSALQAAFIGGREVSVSVQDTDIRSVTLTDSPTIGCQGLGCVTSLTCAPDCTAVIAGRIDPVTTNDRRALGILLTAISNGIPVQNLATDASGVITEVKVNNSPPIP